MRNLRQYPAETETQYFDKFEEAHSPAGAYLPEDQQLICFIDGLDPAVQNRCRMHPRSYQEVGFLELLEFAPGGR